MKLINAITKLSGKQIIVIIALIIIAIIAYQWWLKPKAQDIARKITPSRVLDGTGSESISDERKVFLNKLSKDLYEAIYSTSAWFKSTREELMNQMLSISDKELIYCNSAYGKLSDNTMYYDVDNEIMPSSDFDDKLLARLRELNIDQKK